MSEITERRDMGLYEVSLSVLGLGMGTMLANVHHVWYYVGVRSSFQHAREEYAIPRGIMCLCA